MSEPPKAVVNVTGMINGRPLGRPQVVIIILCALIALLDGLDLQAIGLAAPAIMTALKIERSSFGLVFSAALAGLALGAFALGPIADKVGRRGVLIASVLCFGVFTIATALAGDLNELLAYRFFTGLGLGGAMPSFISLTSEYAPKRLRAVVVSILWAGFPLGGFVGGLLASYLIPVWGWQSLFWVGGVLPILLVAVLVFALPESISYLVASGAPADRVRKSLRRVCPDANIPEDARFVLGEERTEGVSIRHLFTAGRATGTLLLWASFFITFMLLVTNTAWSPTLLKSAGVSVSQAAIAMAMFNLGSVVGTSLAGLLVTRYGARAVLPAAFIGAGGALSLIGIVSQSVALVTLCQMLIGLFLGCGSSGLIALAALYYPTATRSTGIGWAMGMGRFGSFLGPLGVGAFLAWQWTFGSVFLAIAAPCIVAAIAATFVGGFRRKAEEDPDGMPADLDLSVRH